MEIAAATSTGGDLWPRMVLSDTLRGQTRVQWYSDPDRRQRSVTSRALALRAIDHPAIATPADRRVVAIAHRSDKAPALPGVQGLRAKIDVRQ